MKRNRLLKMLCKAKALKIVYMVKPQRSALKNSDKMQIDPPKYNFRVCA